jgi:hypothetical protein
MRLPLKRAATILGAAVLAVGLVATPAQAAAPIHTINCGAGSTSGNVQTCVVVYHSGLHIITADAQAEVVNQSRRLKICLRGPSASIGCTPQSTYRLVEPGEPFSYDWGPDANESPGFYCANLYRDNGDNTTTQLAHYCVDIEPQA